MPILIDTTTDWTKCDWFRDLERAEDYRLVAIAGIPGSGKTTFAATLSEQLKSSIVIPMDGYHLPRSELSASQLVRRGAPDTFDRDALRRDLEAWKESRTGRFPAFDHARKDPEPGAITVKPSHRIVVVEGLYLFLSEWKIADLFDTHLFLQCDLEVAMERLIKRHIESGICRDETDARLRVDQNDRLNAELILNEIDESI